MTIASEIQRLQTAKASIKASIEEKGVEVPSNAKLSDFSTYVDQIQAGSGDDIIDYLSGYLMIDTGMISIRSSDSVSNRYGDYSWKDGTNLYLIKPYEYNDYSSSGQSHIYTSIDCIALPKGATDIVNYDTTMYTSGWNDSNTINYYYINGNKIRFYGSTWQSSTRYRCKELAFSNGTWTMTDIGWDGTTPAEIGGNQDLFYSTVVGSTGGGDSFYYKWRPVAS